MIFLILFDQKILDYKKILTTQRSSIEKEFLASINSQKLYHSNYSDSPTICMNFTSRRFGDPTDLKA